MILSDFLMPQKNDDSNPNEIIPISFDMYQIMEDNLENFYTDEYLIQMQSQAKSGGIKPPGVSWHKKKFRSQFKTGETVYLSQTWKFGENVYRSKESQIKEQEPDPINQAINQPSNLLQEIPGRTKIETRKTNSAHTKDPTHSINNANDRIINNKPFMLDAPFHPDPLLRPPIKPIKQNMTRNQNSQSVQDISPNINFDFEENSPFQEGIISETYQRLDKTFFQEPKELEDLINKGNFVHKYLPKQMDIDKILKIIQRKVLKGTHLPIKIKEIQAGFMCSPYFKDLYLYLSQNKLPSSKMAVRKLETLAERSVLLDSLLFKISSEKRPQS